LKENRIVSLNLNRGRNKSKRKGKHTKSNIIQLVKTIICNCFILFPCILLYIFLIIFYYFGTIKDI